MKSFRLVLTGAGYEVIEATTGAEGIELARRTLAARDT